MFFRVLSLNNAINLTCSLILGQFRKSRLLNPSKQNKTHLCMHQHLLMVMKKTLKKPWDKLHFKVLILSQFSRDAVILTCITDISDYPAVLTQSPGHIYITGSCRNRRVFTGGLLGPGGRRQEHQETPGDPWQCSLPVSCHDDARQHPDNCHW